LSLPSWAKGKNSRPTKWCRVRWFVARGFPGWTGSPQQEAGRRKGELQRHRGFRASLSLSLSLSRASAPARAHFANNLADFGLRFCFILHLRLVCSLLQVNFAFISLHLPLYRPCFMVLGTVSWGLHAALGNSSGCCCGLFLPLLPLAAHNLFIFP
jgi:hypothetical protein